MVTSMRMMSVKLISKFVWLSNLHTLRVTKWQIIREEIKGVRVFSFNDLKLVLMVFFFFFFAL